MKGGGDEEKKGQRTIVDVREVPPRQLHLGPKVLSPEARESLPSKLQPGLDKLDVGALAESVVDDSLVLVDGDGASGVDDVAARRGVGVDRVNGAEEKLLLEVGEKMEITLGLRGREGGAWRSAGVLRRKKKNRELTLLTLTVASLEMTPVPEHGASSKTRSNPPITLGNSLPS